MKQDIAFERFKDIEKLANDQEKHKKWLEEYEGLYFSIGENGKDMILWQKERDKCVYSDKRFNEPLLCLDNTYRAEPNKIQRHPKRLIVEFDNYEGEGREISQERLLKVKEYAKKQGWGFIHSSHSSKNGSDYLWFEFDRKITDNEAKTFLVYIVDMFGGKIDLNFSSSEKRFPVLFAKHWKYSKQREIPIDFNEGKQIDYDLKKYTHAKVKPKIINIHGFKYETAIKDKENKKEVVTARMQDFLKGKVKKEKPIIENFIPEESIISIWGETAGCKSIATEYLSCCVATGKKFLNVCKTRKVPVLYLCTENPTRIEKKRFKAIFKGMRVNPIRRCEKNLSLHYLPRENIGLLNDDVFFNSLKEKIKNIKAKLLVIDTLSPLIPDVDDIKAKEIVQVFNNRFFPLVDEFKLSILFLLHSQKTGRDFLGGIKLKASVDLFYELKRNGKELSLLCHKGREGEFNFQFAVNFINKPNLRPYIVSFDFIRTFEGKQEVSSRQNQTKLEQAKVLILESLENNELKHFELLPICENEGISKRTFNRALNILYEKEKTICKNGKDGGYIIA